MNFRSFRAPSERVSSRNTRPAQQYSRARPSCRVYAAKRSFYEILDLPQGATPKDVKRAYRKKALKLHPDVNTAPDAQQRFMEAKAAFETLVDDGKRAEYDRRLRMGDYNWGGSSSASDFSGYGKGARRQTQEEDNYSFDDLMRDLDKEFSEWGKERKDKGSDSPKSLWEELEDIGGELLDFLEDSLGVDEDKKKSSKSTGYEPFGEDEKLSTPGSKGSSSSYKQETRSNQNTSSSSSSSSSRPGQSASPPSSPPPKSSEDDIEDMLAALKKKFQR